MTNEEAYELGKQAALQDYAELLKQSAEKSLPPGTAPGPNRAAANLPMDKAPVPMKKQLTANTSAITPPTPKSPYGTLQNPTQLGRKATVSK